MFSDWLSAEIDARGWNKSELARRAGLNDSTVSMVINQKRNPGFDFCVSVANALEVRPEVVLRQAGLLPPEPPEVEEEAGLLAAFRRLSRQARYAVVEMARNLMPVNPEDDLAKDGYEAHRPRTLKERVAAGLADDLAELSPEDRDRVYDLMKRLRGDKDTDRDAQSVPVDTDQ